MRDPHKWLKIKACEAQKTDMKPAEPLLVWGALMYSFYATTGMHFLGTAVQHKRTHSETDVMHLLTGPPAWIYHASLQLVGLECGAGESGCDVQL